MVQQHEHLIQIGIMVFLGTVRTVKENLTISISKKVTYSIGVNKLQALSQSETAHSEKMCPLPLPVLLLLPPLTLGSTSAEDMPVPDQSRQH